MASNNRTCLCCGTRYSYCPSCSGADRLKPSWYAEFCSTACKDLWLTCTRFNMKKLTKAEAQSIISTLPLKQTSEYAQCVQRDLENIFQEEPKPKRNRRVEIQPIDEAAAIEPTIIEEIIIEEQPEVAESCEVVKIEDE